MLRPLDVDEPRGSGPAYRVGTSDLVSLATVSTGAGYLNRNSDEEEQARLRMAYGARKYERLVALKNTYDPTNFFRVNHDVKPTV